jgi:DNA gyrase subunit A
MELGVVKQIDIDQEMQAAYLDYAMSVIVSRALPDARDGLKPVHRRILYAMHDMGLRADSPYKKSARIVGEVLGKYHPHGDAAVYEAMARMAQDFSMRYVLVDGQGNFGSVDGDAPAAMRYTEARMAASGLDLMIDIEKDTVEFAENFDGTLDEPAVLPSLLPNLIVNGSSGIAVGMSTSIPPHNISEVCEALVYMLDRWTKLDDVGVPELMQFIKGPDFPTGGLVFRFNERGESDALAHAYAHGRGKITIRAKVHVEQLSRNRNRIVITELPYQTNKSSLIERIATLARDEKIEGITDLRDESDRQGIRIVIDLTRNVDPDEIIAALYKQTPMQGTFSIIMLALVEGVPRTLSLKQALRVFLDHRLEVVKRRSEYDLARARERAHILEGLLVALDSLEAVIQTIRKSRTVETARKNLRKNFKLSETQAQAILDMPLRRLAALEQKKIQDEYKEKQKLIKYLERLLGSTKMMRGAIKEELLEIKRVYGDPRRTVIVEGSKGEAVTMTELVPEQKVWVVVTEGGQISRTFDEKQPKVTTAVKDPPRVMLESAANETLYLFTRDGMAAAVPVHQLERSNDFQQGLHWADVAPLDRDQDVVAALSISPGRDDGYLVLASVGGMVKRVALEDLPGVSANAFRVMGLSRDSLEWAELSSGDDEVILVTAEGMTIRFGEDEVRPMGLPAAGVKGVKLGGADDRVVGMGLVAPRASLWVVTKDGVAKSSPLSEYPRQGRYGAGVITMKFDKGSLLAASAIGTMDDNLVVVTSKGKPKYMRFGLAPRSGRATMGKSVIAMSGKEEVVGVVTPRIQAQETGENNPPKEEPPPKKKAKSKKTKA